ncbi:DNA topoisomerase [Tothia fuscella]|uniref:DNA topoisomerase n=1 Tax=Tothia fuscella TaxID=1048955 RepID=A0A9P4NVE7_9PEZI|nr:DNA topoisomerase [Tothia fuscella]
MVTRILCVAEKPSIAKAVANHLAGGAVTIRHVPQNQFTKNYCFDYNFQPPWGASSVTFTSVLGHIMKHDFPSQYSWSNCNPRDLFDAPIDTFVEERNKTVAKNIEQQARHSDILYIWTDCDREGEHIGAEIRDLAKKVNPRIQVKRAQFNNIERAHVIQAARRPIELDERQAEAVSTRMEIDLRTGAAFSRILTNHLKPMIRDVQELKVISYGSCQFPTLGFVVDRYFRVRNFVPEPFWSIKVMHNKEGIKVNFNWKRVHLFDRMAVTILYERCLQAKTAKVIKTQKRPTSKWRPLPLTTVELQKMGSRFLRMDSQKVMKIAEDLYTKGWISYPRTETDQFDKGMDLKALVQRQTQNNIWGPFAQNLIAGAFQWPKSGRNNDKAHPPIHPVNYTNPSTLSDEESRVYSFVVRRFLACCSSDAVGELTTVEIEYGSEIFSASGLTVIARNYLDVYPYDKWESSQQLPVFATGETFVPTEAKMSEGKTSAPGYLTEPELIALMDANGIGTDATMAEHIAKIKERNYVMTRSQGGGSNNGNQEFIPTTLGVALIEGYENLQFATSLSKPFLRKELEVQMRAICAGTATRRDVVHNSIEQYRDVYNRSERGMDTLKAAVRNYVLGQTNG